MTINFDVTGERRKALATAVSQEMNVPFIYRGVPTFAYEVGSYVIDRAGVLTGADNRELVINLSNLHGFTATTETYDESPSETPAFEGLRLTEREELGLGQERRDPWGEDGMLASDVPEADDEFLTNNITDLDNERLTSNVTEHDDEILTQTNDVTKTDDDNNLVIEIPLSIFTDKAIENLGNIVASKFRLIRKVLSTDSLRIDTDDEKLSFPWFTLTGTDGEADVYMRFICALCDMATRQKRVTAKEYVTGNDKFTMRIFLIRLGFVGKEFKKARKILLRNLTGNSAWKNGRPSERASGTPSVETENTERVDNRDSKTAYRNN